MNIRANFNSKSKKWIGTNGKSLVSNTFVRDYDNNDYYRLDSSGKAIKVYDAKTDSLTKEGKTVFSSFEKDDYNKALYGMKNKYVLTVDKNGISLWKADIFKNSISAYLDNTLTSGFKNTAELNHTKVDKNTMYYEKIYLDEDNHNTWYGMNIPGLDKGLTVGKEYTNNSGHTITFSSNVLNTSIQIKNGEHYSVDSEGKIHNLSKEKVDNARKAEKKNSLGISASDKKEFVDNAALDVKPAYEMGFRNKRLEEKKAMQSFLDNVRQVNPNLFTDIKVNTNDYKFTADEQALSNYIKEYNNKYNILSKEVAFNKYNIELLNKFWDEKHVKPKENIKAQEENLIATTLDLRISDEDRNAIINLFNFKDADIISKEEFDLEINQFKIKKGKLLLENKAAYYGNTAKNLTDQEYIQYYNNVVELLQTDTSEEGKNALNIISKDYEQFVSNILNLNVNKFDSYINKGTISDPYSYVKSIKNEEEDYTKYDMREAMTRYLENNGSLGLALLEKMFPEYTNELENNYRNYVRSGLAYDAAVAEAGVAAASMLAVPTVGSSLIALTTSSPWMFAAQQVLTPVLTTKVINPLVNSAVDNIDGLDPVVAARIKLYAPIVTNLIATAITSGTGNYFTNVHNGVYASGFTNYAKELSSNLTANAIESLRPSTWLPDLAVDYVFDNYGDLFGYDPNSFAGLLLKMITKMVVGDITKQAVNYTTGKAIDYLATPGIDENGKITDNRFLLMAKKVGADKLAENLSSNAVNNFLYSENNILGNNIKNTNLSTSWRDKNIGSETNWLRWKANMGTTLIPIAVSSGTFAVANAATQKLTKGKYNSILDYVLGTTGMSDLTSSILWGSIRNLIQSTSAKMYSKMMYERALGAQTAKSLVTKNFLEKHTGSEYTIKEKEMQSYYDEHSLEFDELAKQYKNITEEDFDAMTPDEQLDYYIVLGYVDYKASKSTSTKNPIVNKYRLAKTWLSKKFVPSMEMAGRWVKNVTGWGLGIENEELGYDGSYAATEPTAYNGSIQTNIGNVNGVIYSDTSPSLQSSAHTNDGGRNVANGSQEKVLARFRYLFDTRNIKDQHERLVANFINSVAVASNGDQAPNKLAMNQAFAVLLIGNDFTIEDGLRNMFVVKINPKTGKQYDKYIDSLGRVILSRVTPLITADGSLCEDAMRQFTEEGLIKRLHGNVISGNTTDSEGNDYKVVLDVGGSHFVTVIYGDSSDNGKGGFKLVNPKDVGQFNIDIGSTGSAANPEGNSVTDGIKNILSNTMNGTVDIPIQISFTGRHSVDGPKQSTKVGFVEERTDKDGKFHESHYTAPSSTHAGTGYYDLNVKTLAEGSEQAFYYLGFDDAEKDYKKDLAKVNTKIAEVDKKIAKLYDKSGNLKEGSEKKLEKLQLKKLKLLDEKPGLHEKFLRAQEKVINNPKAKTEVFRGAYNKDAESARTKAKKNSSSKAIDDYILTRDKVVRPALKELEQAQKQLAKYKALKHPTEALKKLIEKYTEEVARKQEVVQKGLERMLTDAQTLSLKDVNWGDKSTLGNIAAQSVWEDILHMQAATGVLTKGKKAQYTIDISPNIPGKSAYDLPEVRTNSYADDDFVEKNWRLHVTKKYGGKLLPRFNKM